MDSTEVPPSWPETERLQILVLYITALTSQNTMPLCPHHPKLSIGIQKTSAEARILHRMPFLMQPSPLPGLGLAPPMAPITVEAGECKILMQQFFRLSISKTG
jgi:hypothetical protein